MKEEMKEEMSSLLDSLHSMRKQLENMSEGRKESINSIIISYFVKTYGKNNEIRIPRNILTELTEGGIAINSSKANDGITIKYFDNDEDLDAYREEKCNKSDYLKNMLQKVIDKM